jgi:hypothetical protein
MHSQLQPTSATLHINSKHAKTTRRGEREIEPFCVFCESRTHWAQDCKTVTDGHDRFERLKAANRCFLCLNRGHSASNCSKNGKASCSRCKRNHHRAICIETESTVSPINQLASTSVGKIDVVSPDFTYKLREYGSQDLQD